MVLFQRIVAYTRCVYLHGKLHQTFYRSSLSPCRIAVRQSCAQDLSSIVVLGTALLSAGLVSRVANCFEIFSTEGKKLPSDDPRLLQSKGDPFGGISVDSCTLPVEKNIFENRLDYSLSIWRSRGVRGVWMKIPIEKSEFISVAVAHGFVFHHAEKDYCMMTNWLPIDEPNPLPPNPSTQVGVGAIVVNEKGKVLLVQESQGPLRGKDVWKIPTGLANAREDLKNAVVRECLEEVGINAEFEKVIAVRHAHSAMFGKSDMFFVCLLRTTSAGTSFKLQEGEIAKAKWADWNQFLEQAPYPRDTPVWSRLYGLCVGKDGVVGNVQGLQAEQLQQYAGPDSPCAYVYHAIPG